MNQAKKTKNIQCMECGKAMSVGLYEPNKQICIECKVAEPEEIVDTEAIIHATSDETREIVRREIADFDQAQFGENYGSQVRKTMSALGFTPRPSGPGSVEYHKDYGDRSSMRTRVTVLFSRGQFGGVGTDQGKLEGFCITEQAYIPATRESINDLSAAICIDDIESIFNALGIDMNMPETTTFDIKPCGLCGIMTDEIFTNSKTNTGLCKECFTNSIEVSAS
jgi:formylmethanofuran dehydrogenase subunit E